MAHNTALQYVDSPDDEMLSVLMLLGLLSSGTSEYSRSRTFCSKEEEISVNMHGFVIGSITHSGH